MDYLLCIPARETNTRENCEKIHNVLARMSDTYKLRIVPEPVKNKQFPCPPYYKKYRIYKPVKERDTNGEAYLEKEEEEMLLSSCKTEEEQELMKSCIYAYQYSAAIVLKSFREKEKKTPEKAEKPEQERSAQERPSGSDRPERSERSYRNRTADRAAEGNTERTQGREKACSEREKAARVSGTERAADRRSGNRAVPENEKREDRPAYGRRERFERRSLRRGERPEVEKNEVVRDPAQGELPFRAYMETGSLPAFRDTAATVTVQPIQRKKEGYMPMERKPAAQTQEPEPQV